MKIGLASDHRGFKKKEKIKKFLKSKKYEVLDYGTDSAKPVDYSDYAINLSEKVISKEIDFGIVFCGTGIGVSISANKVKGIRCAKIDSVKEARYAKEHNKANVLAIGASHPTFLIKDMIQKFINTKESQEERHQRRIDKIGEYENGN